MREYTKDDLLVLAKRYNNAKRSYLLVDPIQAKHLAVSPTKALEMMFELGDRLCEKYPTARLIIGFAETATAIAAAAATRIPDCRYIHTTREPMPEIAEDKWLYFSEEHSHAVEQKICIERLPQYAAQTDTIILLDDEISTGKTLINIVEQLRSIPEIEGKRIVAASVINRCSEENMARLAEAGIECECLLKLPEEDYTAMVERFDVTGAERIEPDSDDYDSVLAYPIGEPRVGVVAREYSAQCRTAMLKALQSWNHRIPKGGRALVLGTEECMYPALMLGRLLEIGGDYDAVFCHATTRSPIGICKDDDYPIHAGYVLRSAYDNNRTTYIYNPDRYDVVFIVVEGYERDMSSLQDIAAVMKLYGDHDPYIVVVEVME